MKKELYLSDHNNYINKNKIILKINKNFTYNIKGDTKLLSLMISNVINNASNLSDHSNIYMILNRDNKNNLSIEISDNGTRINKKHKKLLNKYLRLKDHASTILGTGLNLLLKLER